MGANDLIILRLLFF